MRKAIIAGLAMVLGLSVGSANAGIDLNEVGAFLVFPGVEARGDDDNGDDPSVETFMTITNTSSTAIRAHVAFINGDSRSSRYCYECNFDVPMTGLDTETLVLTRRNGVTHILNLDTGAQRTCAQRIGFVTVNVEDSNNNVKTDNILLGSQVVVDYDDGTAYSVPAIPIQGGTGDGNRYFAFNGVEYRKFPSVIGADFLAPDSDDEDPDVNATLVLFTLAFDRQFPPLTDCSVIGFDAAENQFSNSFQFGCWTAINLGDIDPEFTYPYLGVSTDFHEHGWVQLACTVYGTGRNGVVSGGVHGAITQTMEDGGKIRRNADAEMEGTASWARILFQSGTVGDALTYHIEDPARGGQF